MHGGSTESIQFRNTTSIQLRVYQTPPRNIYGRYRYSIQVNLCMEVPPRFFLLNSTTLEPYSDFYLDILEDPVSPFSSNLLIRNNILYLLLLEPGIFNWIICNTHLRNMVIWHCSKQKKSLKHSNMSIVWDFFFTRFFLAQIVICVYICPPPHPMPHRYWSKVMSNKQ